MALQHQALQQQALHQQQAIHQQGVQHQQQLHQLAQRQQILHDALSNAAPLPSHDVNAAPNPTTDEPTSANDPSTDRLCATMSAKAKAPPWLDRAIRKQGASLEKSARRLLRLRSLKQSKMDDFQKAADGVWPSGARKPKHSINHAEAGNPVSVSALATIAANPPRLDGKSVEGALEELALFHHRSKLVLDSAIIDDQIAALELEVSFDSFRSKCAAISRDKAAQIEHSRTAFGLDVSPILDNVAAVDTLNEKLAQDLHTKLLFKVSGEVIKNQKEQEAASQKRQRAVERLQDAPIDHVFETAVEQALVSRRARQKHYGDDALDNMINYPKAYVKQSDRHRKYDNELDDENDMDGNAFDEASNYDDYIRDKPLTNSQQRNSSINNKAAFLGSGKGGRPTWSKRNQQQSNPTNHKGKKGKGKGKGKQGANETPRQAQSAQRSGKGSKPQAPKGKGPLKGKGKGKSKAARKGEAKGNGNGKGYSKGKGQRQLQRKGKSSGK